MSTTGQIVGAVAGGVLGAFVGPAGALQGAAWGAALGGLLDPPKGPTVSGPRLNDLSWQQSAYGANIPRIYGTVALSGNVVWLEHNKLKEVVKKKKSGGKGGGSSPTTKTYTYFATFALMLCQGEVAGVRRIWCGDKLIYNAGSDDLETIIASNQAAKGWKLYRGTDDQLPDPRYEADIGVGNAPAFRGYTYIAFYDFALANYSNTLQAAQFKIELVSAYDQSPVEIYRNSQFRDDDGLFTLFNGEDSEICRTADQINAFDLTDWVNVYRTGGAVREPLGLSRSGRLVAGGLVIQGELKYAVPFVGQIATDKGTFSFPYGGTNSNFRGVYAFGRMYLRWAGSGDIYGSADGFSVRSNSGYYFNVCAGDGVVIAVNGTKIDLLDIDDLGLISSSTFSSSYELQETSTYVSFDNGVLWVLPTNDEKIIQAFDPLTGEKVAEYSGDVFAPIVAGSIGQPGAVIDNILYRKPLTGPAQAVNLNAFASDNPPLSSVITAECSLSAIVSAIDLDVSALTQEVNGYRVSGGTIRSVIEPLQGAYPFDVLPSGYKIKFVPRGQSPVVTIPWEDLAAANGDEIGDSLPYSREMDSQLPQKVTITALSSTREYGSSTQSSPGRPSTSAVNIEQRDIPLVLSDDEIAQMAEKLEMLRWLERDDFSFSLPPTYLALEPADVVNVLAKFGTFELHCTEINYEEDGRLTCKAKPNSAPLYSSSAVGAPGPGPDGTISIEGPSLLVLLDIPIVDETLQNEPGIVSVMTGYSEGWPGGVVVRSNDNGQTWSELQAFVGKGTLGYALTALVANPCTMIDQSSLSVSLISGELESVTRDQMLSGVNYAAYGVDGRWEVVRFQNADLQSDGTYLVSGIKRGDRGTEWATGLHRLGDWFVLLDDPDNAFITVPVESLELPRLYRGVTSGGSIDDAADVPFAYRGVNLECLSPVYAKGSRDGSSNFSGSFTRRSRLSSSWWANGVPAPIGETAEAYEVDVMSGLTVKRTISVTSPAWAYSAADQTTDFGSPQSSITFRIYQLSASVGRGYPLEVTL